MIVILGHNFIGGARNAAGTLFLQSLGAASGEMLPYRFMQATPEEVDTVTEIVASAYSHYWQLPASCRVGFLDIIATELGALDADFIAIICRETAPPATRIQGEHSRTSGQLRLFAEILRRGDFYGARIGRTRPGRKLLLRVDLRQCWIDFGPVAVFDASNFPPTFSTVGGDTIAALATGCPVVFKAYSEHMAAIGRVAAVIPHATRRTSMPAGVFNMIHGGRVGERLVHHPAIQTAGFTGSLKGGHVLRDTVVARAQLIPVFAEMSDISPVALLPTALKKHGEAMADELSALVALGCGQFCTNSGLVISVRSVRFSAFPGHFITHMDDQLAQTMLSAGMLTSYEKGLVALYARPCVRHLTGQPQEGRQVRPQLPQADISLLLEGDGLLQEEVLGPASVAAEVADHVELGRALYGLHEQFTVTLITEAGDLASFTDLVPLLEQKTGRLLLNGYPTGAEVYDTMVHDGPYPTTSSVCGTSVDILTIEHFLYPVCYQNHPDAWLPEVLKDGNLLGVTRLVDGIVTRVVVA